MNQLLKIVRGPNTGAEARLPEGVAVTLGKGDDCDIILADATLPDAPLNLEATPDAVLLDGERVEPFHVIERGATAFAVGPADAPWGELVWAKPAKGGAASAAPDPDADTASAAEAAPPLPPAKEEKKHRGCLVWLVLLVLLLLLLLGLGWHFRAQVKRAYSSIAAETPRRSGFQPLEEESGKMPLLPELANRFNLVATDNKLVGNFATRAERLAATAEAYAAQPGIELDFSDDESLRTAAEDTLALIGETQLRVAAATNRVVALAGTPFNLRRALEALSADLPKLENVDVAGIDVSRRGAEGAEAQSVEGAEAQSVEENLKPLRASAISAPLRDKNPAIPALPVCGILTTPYPCLVLRSGQRVMEGAPMGEWTVAKIEADSVTLTNAERSVTWNP